MTQRAMVKRDEGPLLEERQDGLAVLGAGQITSGCNCLSLALRTITSFSTPTQVRLSHCTAASLRAED